MKSWTDAFRSRPLIPLFLCLSVSALAGSLWFNNLPEEIKGQLGILGKAWTNQPGWRIRENRELFYSVFARRAGEAAVVWLAGMTPCSLAVLGLAFAAAGFSISAVLSALTVETGLMALPLFLLALFPQCLFYGPVAAALLNWGVKGEKKMRAAAFLILLFLLGAGAALEVCVNPRWMAWVGKMIFS